MLNFFVFTFTGHILLKYLCHKDYGDSQSIGCIGYHFVCKILECFHSFCCVFKHFEFFCRLPMWCYMQTPCLSIGLFKPFKAKPTSTTLKSLTSTRCCHCWLFVLHSKLTSSRWSRRSKLAIRRGTKFFTFHLSIGKGKRNSKSNTCLFGVCIRCLRMRDLNLSC